MSKNGALALLACLIILGSLLRAYQLTARSLWFDEAFSWRLIQFPIPEMIARDASDVHPPLYYLVLKGWSVVFGSSLAALRGFSVAAAAATIAASYLFVSSASKSRGAGLLAAALLAVSGWQIQFAWEARMYTMGTALALVSSWALLKAMRSEPQRIGPWLLYALLSAAFAYVHYYAFFTILAHLFFVVGGIAHRTRGHLGEILQAKRLWFGLSAALVATLLYTPWLPTFFRQNSQVQASYWIPPLGGWSIPDTFYRMFAPTAGIPPHSGFGWIIMAMLPLGATVLILILLIKARSRQYAFRDADWLVVAAACTPFIVSIALSLVTQSLYQDRFFVFAHLFILAAVAMLLWRIPFKIFRGFAIVVVISSFLVTSVLYWQELDVSHKGGAHAAVRYIVDRAEMNQPILVSSPFIYFSILHYIQEEHPGRSTPQLFSESGELAHFAGGPILTENDIVGRDIFEKTASSMWVVDTTGFGASALVPPQPWQAAETKTYPEVFAHQGEVTVTRYIRR